MSTDEIADLCAEYEKNVTVFEPVERSLDYYASDLCKCCGSCVMLGRQSSRCPGRINPDQVLYSPQGFGPARNIVGYTGGDLACCPDFYIQLTERIKSRTSNIHVLFETNGYGLTPQNLEYLQTSGVDAFWLDIKAFDQEKHRWLTGCTNERILKLPEEIRQRDFVLEVLSLYIPEVVEADDLEKIAQLLYAADSDIPFTLLAFFPEYRMKNYRSPTVKEMVSAYQKIKAAGLKNLRLGNLGVFVRTQADQTYLMENVEPGAF